MIPLLAVQFGTNYTRKVSNFTRLRLVKLQTLLVQLIPNCTASHGITYTWVTFTTFLGFSSYISVTKECYQIGFLNWKFIEELFFTSLSSLFSKDLFGYISGILTTSMQSRNSLGADVQEKTSPEMLIYRLSERRY